VHKSNSFASQYPQNTQGHIVFPDDMTLRRELFAEKVQHPAHNNLYMLDELAQYLAKPGEWVLDPMAGAGSIMWVARHGYKVGCIELGKYFSEQLETNKVGFTGEIFIWPETDCLEILPVLKNTVQVIIFSPPYADQLQTRSGHAIYDPDKAYAAGGIEHFTYDHPANLGNMKKFKFDQMMRRIYKACLEALTPGGYCCMIIKDQMRQGQRVGYGALHTRMALMEGFTLYEWYNREAIGRVFGTFNLSRGIAQVTDEHIIILQRPV